MTTPDAAAVALGILRGAIAPVKVATQVPANRPEQFVRIIAAGGDTRRLVLTTCHINWEATAPDDVTAEHLAARVREAFIAAEGTSPCGFQLLSSSCTMPTWFPEDGSARYTGQATLLLRTP